MRVNEWFIRALAVAAMIAIVSTGQVVSAQGFGRATFGQTPVRSNVQAPSFGSFDQQRPQQRQFSGPGNLPAASEALQRPAVSPFLRLLDNRNNGTLDLFTIIRPEQEFRRQANDQARALRQLNQDAQGLARQQQGLAQRQDELIQARDPGIGNPANPLTGFGLGLRPTGHVTTFGTTLDYFPGSR